ncbi:hypothetical protein WG906_19135 [Pedobacter sp. P351]|uniref:hypothetical protein n=1 Tax=Pedobacter superstes TaxID=3133441 RepID=UPI0030A54F1F
MKLISSIGGGLAGACALTILHEIVKRINNDAPRMDLLGMQTVKKGMQSAEQPVPEDKHLYQIALAGDIVSNTIYYSLGIAGKRKYIWPKGALTGLSAGIAAIFLPKALGLNPAYSSRTLTTKAFTTGLYLIGGLVASAVAKKIENKTRPYSKKAFDSISYRGNTFLNG